MPSLNLRLHPLIHLSLLLAALIASPVALGAQNLADHTYSSTDIEAGARVYVADCALCHGASGDGVDGVNLRLGRFRTARSDEDLRRIITTGVGSRMPAFDLGDGELNGIVAYIRAGFDPSGVAVRVGDAARGQSIFEGEGRCVGCHRVNGVGGRLLAPDLGEIGIVRTPAALQRTILDPTAALLPINRPVRAVTRSGETIRGRRLNEDTYTVQLVDSEGRLRSLVKAELAEYEVSTTATMRPTTLSADQVADVIGYLLSLRGVS
jgi:putative heme-binding domain-containing protein